jgi:hypothetical protein
LVKLGESRWIPTILSSAQQEQRWGMANIKIPALERLPTPRSEGEYVLLLARPGSDRRKRTGLNSCFPMR